MNVYIRHFCGICDADYDTHAAANSCCADKVEPTVTGDFHSTAYDSVARKKPKFPFSEVFQDPKHKITA